MLTLNSTVSQWVCEYPQTARLFEELQIDYCCDGNSTLGKACEDAKLDADATIRQLENVISCGEQAPSENWQEVPLAKLCDHIQETHHSYLRRELPRLDALIHKVVTAHRENHAELTELQRAFASLCAELEPHMFKEEQILFPAIRRLERDADHPNFAFGTVANPIRMMEHEHKGAGNLLGQIRELANGFSVPSDACNTYREMLRSLESLEHDMHQHVHKENNILFPRAQELEDSRIVQEFKMA